MRTILSACLIRAIFYFEIAFLPDVARLSKIAILTSWEVSFDVPLSRVPFCDRPSGKLAVCCYLCRGEEPRHVWHKK